MSNDFQNQKKIIWKNRVLLTVRLKTKAELDQREKNFDVYKIRGQWEGLNLVTLKFVNKRQFHHIKELNINEIITVSGKLGNFFSSKEKKTFCSIIVQSYKKK